MSWLKANANGVNRMLRRYLSHLICSTDEARILENAPQ